MKQGIHPDYHKIKVVMTDGSSFETFSTYGKEGDSLQLDVDPKTHPAWIGGGSILNQRASQVAKFNTKFGNIGTKKAAPAAPATAAKEESKPEEKAAEAAPKPAEEKKTAAKKKK